MASELLAIGKRLAAGTSLLVFCAFLNCLSQVLIERHFMEHVVAPRLLDIAFVYLPHYWKVKICDWFSLAVMASTLIPLAIFHPKRSQIFRRFLVFQSGIFLLRALFIIVTILPQPSPECKPDPIAGSPHESLIIEIFRIMVGKRITCGDSLFSGHAANVTMLAALGFKFAKDLLPSRQAYQVYKIYLYSLLVITLASIVLTWFHYTVDVLVSLLVVSQLWVFYHGYIERIGNLAPGHLIVWYEYDYLVLPDGPQKTSQAADCDIGIDLTPSTI